MRRNIHNMQIDYLNKLQHLAARKHMNVIDRKRSDLANLVLFKPALCKGTYSSMFASCCWVWLFT